MADENTNQPDEQKSPANQVHSLRTFQSDVEDALKEGQGSLTKIALAENDKRVREGFSSGPEEPSTRTSSVLWISGTLVTLGILAIIFLFFFRNQTDTPLSPTIVVPELISTERDMDLNIKGLNREQIITLLKKQVSENALTLSTLLGIHLKEGAGVDAQQVSAPAFFQRLQSHIPNELVRSLSDTFLFGLHALNVNQPFIVLKISYYQNAFIGMLAWEKNLPDDIGALFIPPEPTRVASTSAELLIKQGVFEDMVVKNRDTRALRDSSGRIVFLYSFPDKNTLILTTNADTLQKVTDRLFAGKLVQ
ncbi:MAG: hypothetical protein NUV54_02110 [Candidatus Taylorbacteria bacterium]|nr:hypothetical protein [Candidatus Taylorbacteria bacterium]